jgi:NADH dehydrogenase FAD-containing subunit
MEIANSTTDRVRRRAALTFVVVGAGYAGTELTAQMARLTTNLLPFYPALAPDDIRWILVDMASAVMPELGEHLGTYALGVLRRRNVEVRLGVSVSEATASEVTFTDGTSVDCTTLVWCAGVTPNPLIGQLGLPTAKGRLDVDLTLSVAGHPEVYAIGDAAAVPDSTKGSDPDSHVVLCPPTAQHAIRQASAVARNIAASLGRGTSRPYHHGDLGLVVDLGGHDAAATPAAPALARSTRQNRYPRVSPLRPSHLAAPSSRRVRLGAQRETRRRRLVRIAQPRRWAPSPVRADRPVTRSESTRNSCTGTSGAARAVTTPVSSAARGSQPDRR